MSGQKPIRLSDGSIASDTEAQKVFDVILGLYDSDDFENRDAITSLAQTLEGLSNIIRGKNILQDAGLLALDDTVPDLVKSLIKSSFVYDDEYAFEGVKSPFECGSRTAFVSKRDKNQRIKSALTMFEELKDGNSRRSPEDSIWRIKIKLREAGADLSSTLFPGQGLSHEEALTILDGYCLKENIKDARRYFDRLLTLQDAEELSLCKEGIDENLEKAGADYDILDPAGNSTADEMRREIDRRYVNSRLSPLVREFVDKLYKSGNNTQVGEIHEVLKSKFAKRKENFAELCSSANISPDAIEECVFKEIQTRQNRGASLLSSRSALTLRR